MLEAGADLIDVGGESTRPGAGAVDEREEIARVVPVIAALRAATKAPISIDTMKPSVAIEASNVGASLWNDVSALRTPGALETAAALHAPMILMHMQGEPRTMQADPRYHDVVAEVIAFLKERVAAAEGKGLKRIWVDPGIGFGKTLEHNLALFAAIPRLAAHGYPLLVGVSRKGMFKAIVGREVTDRTAASVAAALLAVQKGAAMVRVHDVRETRDALRVLAVMGGV